MIRALCLLALGSALYGSDGSAACPSLDPQAAALLAGVNAHAAVRQDEQNFQALVTLQRGAQLRVLHVRQAVHEGARLEQLTLLDRDYSTVLREAHPLDCNHPGHRLLHAAARAAEQASAAAQAGEGDCGIAAHYRIDLQQGGSVAGRQTVRLLVQPRDLYRHGYVLEVDPERHLLLKVVTVAAGGTVLEQFQYASLAFETEPAAEGPDLALAGGLAEDAAAEPTAADTAAPPAALPPTQRQGGGRAAELPSAGDRTDPLPGPGWQVAWVPPGFVPTEPVAAGARRSFTDGFSVFSVFLERAAGGLQPGEGVVREGSTVAYTRGTRLEAEPVLITVLGEVPVNTARMVADAVRPLH